MAAAASIERPRVNEIFHCECFWVMGLKILKTIKALANQFDLKLEMNSSYLFRLIWYLPNIICYLNIWNYVAII